jgi:glycerol-3-phosphate cytidylyltransferase
MGAHLKLDENTMKKVITYGTFDLFHFGHLEILRRAKSFGDYLIVAVSTDEFNWNEKHKRSVYPYKERAAIVAGIKYVDLVIPEKGWGQKAKDVQEHKVDIFVMGDDWKGRFDQELAAFCKVVYLSRTNGISSSEIKQSIKGPVELRLDASGTRV